MNFLQKIIITFFIISIHPPIVLFGADIQQNLADIQNTVNQGQQTLKLDFIPQYQSYSSLIPKQFKEILSKADLTDIKVEYDSQALLGALSATTSIAGTPAVVRIILGSALSTATSFQEQFKQNLQNYQNGLKFVPQTGTDLAKKGLTYISSSSNTTPEEKQMLINEALKKQAATSSEEEKVPAEQANQKPSWVSKQLAGLQGGIIFVLPRGFKFSSISNDLKFLDYIDFEEVILGLGSGFTDPVYDSIPQGFSLIAKVNSKIEPFKTIASFLNKIPGPAKLNFNQPFSLRGGMMLGIGGSSFGFALPGQIGFKLGNKTIASTDQLNLSLMLLPLPEGNAGVSGISTGLSGGFTVFLNQVDSKLNPLDFQIAFSIDTSAEATLNGVMDGLLNLGAVGLPLEFGNVTLTAGINPENIETLGLAELGMMGEVDFGYVNNDTQLKAAIDVKLSGQNTNLLVYGDLEPQGKKRDALSLKDLVNLTITAFKDLGIHVGKFDATLPNLGVNKASFYFSPRNTLFANKLWKAGAKVDLKLDIFGVEASLECDIGSSGFEATGFLSEVDLGPLKITGAGKSKKCSINDTCLISCDNPKAPKNIVITDPHAPKNITDAFALDRKSAPKILKDWTDYNKLKGPIVNIRFKPPFNIGMFISAEVDFNAGKLGSLTADACFDISLKGVNAHFEARAFNELDAVFTLNAQDFLKPKKWYVCAKLKQNALTSLEKEIEKLVNSAKREIAEQINHAQAKVKSAKHAYDSAFEEAKSGIHYAEEKVHSLKNKLDKAKNQCAGHKSDSSKKYPYEKPHQFNPHYVEPKYAFIGNMTIMGTEIYKMAIDDKEIELVPNKPYPLIKEFITFKKSHYSVDELMKFMKHKKNPLVINKGDKFSCRLNSLDSKVQPIKIFMENTDDIITLYIWRSDAKNIGYKIIFDTKKFSDYVTQSYFYDNLSEHKIAGFAFGLIINGDNLDITDPKNAVVPLNRMFNINILGPKSKNNNLYLMDISLFPKINEHKLIAPMSYTDLFFGSQKIIQVVPLDNNDFNRLNT